MVLESEAHPSLHRNCHHQIIFAKFNLKVYYPPPYERTIFHYSQATVDHIQQAINILIGRMLSLILMLMPKCPFLPTMS